MFFYMPPISYRDLGYRRLNRLYNRILCAMMLTSSPVGL